MERHEIFMQVIRLMADKLKTRLILDAQVDFYSQYDKEHLTPNQMQQKAQDYVRLFLAQELQFSINKSLNPKPKTI